MVLRHPLLTPGKLKYYELTKCSKNFFFTSTMYSPVTCFVTKLKAFALLAVDVILLNKNVHWNDLQVRLPSMDGRVALVPWADMLNHSPEVSFVC